MNVFTRRTIVLGLLATPATGLCVVPLLLRFVIGRLAVREGARRLAMGATARGFVRASAVRSTLPAGLLLSEAVAAAMSDYNCEHLVVRGNAQDLAVEANRPFSENLKLVVENLQSGTPESSSSFFASAATGVFTFQLSETQLPYRLAQGPKRFVGEVVRTGGVFSSPNFFLADPTEVSFE